MAKLEDLRPELLLEIGRHFRNRHRNSDLTSLSLVSRNIRPIAQECLLQEPWFKLTNIHLFMAELSRQSWIIPKIRALELWSTDEGRQVTYENLTVRANLPITNFQLPPLSLVRACYPAVICPPDLWDQLDYTACADIAKQFTGGVKHEYEWMHALQFDVLPALLGLLLVSLPNLKALRCSAMWLMDFPILFSTLSVEVTAVIPPRWKHDWLMSVMEKLASQLEVFEVPTNFSNMGFAGRPSALFNLSSFTKLRKLSISMLAIYHSYTRPRLPSPWPVPLLPPNIQTLQISDGYQLTKGFIEDLCRVKRKGTLFQCLSRIEVFFSSPLDFDWNDSVGLRTSCSRANVSLSLYFPGFDITSDEVDRSLWSLKNEQSMAQIGWEKFSKENPMANDVAPYDWARIIAMERYGYGTFEGIHINSDAEGDIEMSNSS